MAGIRAIDRGVADLALPIRRALAAGRIARRLRWDRGDRHGAWQAASDAERRAFAKRVLYVRARLNRAGLLRWRVVRPEVPDAR